MADISGTIGRYKFNYRVAAILEHRQTYLLTTATHLDYWFLPGGRVGVGESSVEAIARELDEELGIEPPQLRLLWIVENFFTNAGQNQHELSFYFVTSLPQSDKVLAAPSFVSGPDGEEFQWFSLEAIQTLDLRPRFLKNKLSDIVKGPRHIVFRDDVNEYVEY